jgi:hypothetical protein
MATLYITEYARQSIDASARVVYLAEEGAIAEQTVAIGGASAQSVALNANTSIVRLHTDAICSVAFGANPTATTANRRMSANTTEYFAVDRQSGAVKKFAVISNT